LTAFPQASFRRATAAITSNMTGPISAPEGGSDTSFDATVPAITKSNASDQEANMQEKVPGHSHYAKDGLRTDGDGYDHDHEPPVSSVK
jgi:hypothetical protein